MGTRTKAERQKLMTDLDFIGIRPTRFPYFKNEYEKQAYNKLYGHNYDRTFLNTTVLSKDFIAQPQYLNYDWLRFTQDNIESSVAGFGKMFRYHLKYDRKNNERTIIHAYLKQNRIILERDVFVNYLHETPLYELNSNETQICDFILQPNLPDYQDTTFFEVKKEDVQLMVDRKKKRPQFSNPMHKHLYQISDYQSYSQFEKNHDELSRKLGYKTRNYSYQLLAGRLERKKRLKRCLTND